MTPTPRAVRKKKTYTAQCKCGQKFDNYLDAVHHTPDMCTPPRPPEGKLEFKPDACGCYTWKHEGTGCEMKRLWALNAKLVAALEECEEAMSDVFRENKQIGRDYLSGTRQRVRALLREAAK